MANPVRPEDVLPAGVDDTVLGGQQVRKGSVAAFVANARRLEQLTPGTDDHAAVEAALLELTPALRAVGVLEVFTPVSPYLADLIRRA